MWMTRIWFFSAVITLSLVATAYLMIPLISTSSSHINEAYLSSQKSECMGAIISGFGFGVAAVDASDSSPFTITDSQRAPQISDPVPLITRRSEPHQPGQPEPEPKAIQIYTAELRYLASLATKKAHKIGVRSVNKEYTDKEIYILLHKNPTGVRIQAIQELKNIFEYWKDRYPNPNLHGVGGEDDGKLGESSKIPGAPEGEVPFSKAQLEREIGDLNDLILEAFRDGKMGKPYLA